MFTEQERQVVIQTLKQRRDWLLKNSENASRDGQATTYQEVLTHIVSALNKLAPSEPKNADRQTSDTLPQHRPPERIRVLIVDDDDLSAQLAATYLQAVGIQQIETASDGLEAINMLFNAKKVYHLVLCDWDMPIKNGLDVHNAMRASERYQQTCFMLVTAITEAKLIREAIEQGVDDYLAKPVSQETLIKKIGKVFTLINPAAS